MPTQHDIFISHSSKDQALADKLVDILLTNGCGVSVNSILCTSLEGMKIPAGTPSFIEFLRQEIKNTKLVILLLTENYFDSTFCVCELGACWGMGLNTYPLVVRPLDKGNLKATLKVTQAGNILDASDLDELRDAVIDRIEAKVKTARWNMKRDEFLKAAPEIIDKLPKPSKVNRVKLDEAKANYQEALDELSSKEEEIETLQAQIAELEKLKPKKQVRAIARKYSTDEDEFERLCGAVRDAFGELYSSTTEAFYQRSRSLEYFPTQDDADDVQSALESEEIREGRDEGFIPDETHPLVSDASVALTELQSFMGKLAEDSVLRSEFSDNHRYPFSSTNRQFWNEHLLC